VVLFRNEELKANLSIVEKSAKIFETLIIDKNNESLSLAKYIALSDNFRSELNKNNPKEYVRFLKSYAKEYNIEDIVIFDRECKTIYTLNSATDTFLLRCYQSAKSEILFNYDKIAFDVIVPIGNKEDHYIFIRSLLKNSEIKNLLVDNMDFSIIEKKSGLRVFTTFGEIQNESEKTKIINFDTKIKIFKKKFLYKYFSFKTNPKLENFLMEIIVTPEFYKIRIDKLGYLSLTLFFFWALATFLFFWITKRLLIVPIRKMLIVANDISRGNYKMRLEVNSKNEIGTLAQKFNSMVNSLQLKEIQLSNANKRLEDEIVKRTKKLQLALDKLRSYDNQKSDMFYTVIHDLKNPMTVVSGYANFLLQYNNISNEKRSEILIKISKESERLTKMLNDFLKNIREENSLINAELKPLDILPILEYFYTIYEIQAKDSLIDFVWNVRTPLPLINGNKEHLEHVISNLLSNAFKFTKEMGMIKISSRIDNDHLLITISDTGPGIKSGYEKEIFEKFKKIESGESGDDKHGSGLGLYIVSQIIKIHNGEIWVTNNQGGVGCSFTFSLPIVHLK